MPKLNNAQKVPANKPGNDFGNAKEGKNTKYSQPPAVPQVFVPGVESVRATPYKTGEDLERYSEERQKWEEGLHEADYNYETSALETAFNENEITKGAANQSNTDAYNFAGRGLGHSSIRDADLFDIAATAELKKQFLDTQLTNLRTETEAKKASISAAFAGFQEGMGRKEVENAQSANEGLPQWSVEPHYEAAKSPAPKAQLPKPAVGNAHPLTGPSRIGPSVPVAGTTGVSGGTNTNPFPVKPKAKVGNRQIAGKLYG